MILKNKIYSTCSILCCLALGAACTSKMHVYNMENDEEPSEPLQLVETAPSSGGHASPMYPGLSEECKTLLKDLASELKIPIVKESTIDKVDKEGLYESKSSVFSAAVCGDLYSIYKICNLFHEVEKNYIKVIPLLEWLSNLNFPKASLILFRFHYDCKTLEEDLPKALVYFEKAFEVFKMPYNPVGSVDYSFYIQTQVSFCKTASMFMVKEKKYNRLFPVTESCYSFLKQNQSNISRKQEVEIALYLISMIVQTYVQDELKQKCEKILPKKIVKECFEICFADNKWKDKDEYKKTLKGIRNLALKYFTGPDNSDFRYILILLFDYCRSIFKPEHLCVIKEGLESFFLKGAEIVNDNNGLCEEERPELLYILGMTCDLLIVNSKEENEKKILLDKSSKYLFLSSKMGFEPAKKYLSAHLANCASKFPKDFRFK